VAIRGQLVFATTHLYIDPRHPRSSAANPLFFVRPPADVRRGVRQLSDALGLVEVAGLAPALVALDVLDKAADVRLVQVELNDQLGALIKITGSASAVRAAVGAAEAAAGRMRVGVVTDVINAPDPRAWPAIESKPEFNALMESEVVYIPGRGGRRGAGGPATGAKRETERTNVNGSFALGLIETQGLTAVLEALDTAAKAADVEVVGREKLGGGYVTVIIKGDVAAVQAAVDAGRARVEGMSLGKVIATHVIARPSEAVLSILPKA
jgi:carbon dioxide concentrating mechanism protein CcmO